MDSGGLAAPLASTNQAVQANLASLFPAALPLALSSAQALSYQKKKALKVMTLLADLQ